jgi:Transposase and inactivated derivatives
VPAPLSRDMRERIIEASKSGDSVRKIAREKGVGTNTVSCLLRLYRETGSCEPRPLNNGRKPRLDAETLEKIRKRIAEQPDIALYELKEEYALPVSIPALCKTVNKKLGLRRKKNGSRCGAAPEGCSIQEGAMERAATKV